MANVYSTRNSQWMIGYILKIGYLIGTSV